MNYTEEDILDYLDGSFKGSREELQTAIKANAQLAETLRLYQDLYRLVQTKTAAVSISNLPEKVLHGIEEKKRRKSQVGDWLMLILFTALTIGGIIMCANYINAAALLTGNGADLLIVIACGVFVSVFAIVPSVVDTNFIKKRYSIR